MLKRLNMMLVHCMDQITVRRLGCFLVTHQIQTTLQIQTMYQIQAPRYDNFTSLYINLHVCWGVEVSNVFVHTETFCKSVCVREMWGYVFTVKDESYSQKQKQKKTPRCLQKLMKLVNVSKKYSLEKTGTLLCFSVRLSTDRREMEMFIFKLSSRHKLRQLRSEICLVPCLFELTDDWRSFDADDTVPASGYARELG